MRCRSLSMVLSLVITAAPTLSVLAQGSDASIGAFVSMPSASGAARLAGLGLTLAGRPGFAFRATGRIALKTTNTRTVGSETRTRPWGADLDAVFALSGRPFGSYNRSIATFAFVGIGASAIDTLVERVIDKSWSYGLGTLIPLGSALDVFAESRWRISEFVLPTAKPKPTRMKDWRFGMSLHLR